MDKEHTIHVPPRLRLVIRIVIIIVLPILLVISFSNVVQTKVVNYGIDKCAYYGWPLHTKVQESKAITNEEYQQRINNGQISAYYDLYPGYFDGPQCTLPSSSNRIINYFIFFAAILLLDRVVVVVMKRRSRKEANGVN